MRTIRNRLAVLRLLVVVLYCTAAVYLAWLSGRSDLIQTAAQQGSYTCLAGTADGTIYDRNGQSLTNASSTCVAVVAPSPEAAAALLPYVTDTALLSEKLQTKQPFVIPVNTADIDCPDVTVLTVPERYAESQTAQHLIGYTAEGQGVTGLEYAFDSILRQEETHSSWEVTFSVDGTGQALAGERKQIRYGANPTQGVITTLDARIQRICEAVGTSLQKGCVVAMEVDTGDILGLASFPSYSSDDLETALEDPDSPLINRAFYAYPVGSIFKLVTAACAWENGIAGSFQWDCTGQIAVGDQLFHCHDLTGHGHQTMALAMRNSCNPYFIALSQALSGTSLLETARALGFGEEIMLCSGMTASGGTLPTAQQLSLPGERANFSFGQGVLTASPVQIARMTCAIAGDGSLPMGQLVRGLTENGRDVLREEPAVHTEGISEETAQYLRSLMCYTAVDHDFQGKPKQVTMGAKTSTAQTGRLDENGEEYCHGWVTAFFPANEPQYVVTVLAEDAGYGNDTAAPVLRQIAAAIMDE